MSMSGNETRSRIQKALKKQFVLERINVGNAQRISDQAAAAASRPARNVVLFGVADEVQTIRKYPRTSSVI